MLLLLLLLLSMIIHYYWVNLSSVNPFQVYYKLRQLLLQSATVYFITKGDCLLLQSATILLQSAIGVTKCDRTVSIRDFNGNSGKGFEKLDTR